MNRLTARPEAARDGHRPWGPGAAGAALVLSLALGACSSSGAPGAGAGAGATSPSAGSTGTSATSPSSGSSTGQTQSSVLPGTRSGVTFHGKIQVTGAVKLTTTFTEKDTAVSSCAAVPSRGDAAGGTFTVPSPHGRQTLHIHVKVTHLHGVGTYPPSAMQADKSDSIRLRSGGHTTDYVLTSHPAAPVPGQVMGKEVLFLGNDGSGELAFSGAHKLGQRSRPAIAGLVSWTCSN